MTTIKEVYENALKNIEKGNLPFQKEVGEIYKKKCENAYRLGAKDSDLWKKWSFITAN